MKIAAIIPARYASTRLPGKPLIDIAGKTMIQRVYEQTLKAQCIDEVWIATDHPAIYQHLKTLDYNVLMTAEYHQSGTDRIAEVALQLDADVCINVQGDEPFIHPAQIDQLAMAFLDNSSINIATLIRENDHPDDIQNPNIPKVAVGVNNNALYFSRSPIPYPRNENNHSYYTHIGMYGFRRKTLIALSKLPSGKLENIESLEQLRWLENGYTIHTLLSKYDSISIDTPEDVEKALTWLEKNNQK